MAYGLHHLADDPWGKGLGEPPPMDHRAGGTRSHYHPAIAREILYRILNGQTVKQVAADPDMPAYCTIFHWARMHPEFGWRWREAREELARSKVGRIATRDEVRRFREARKLPTPDGKRWWFAGRRSTYTTKAARAFCARVRQGQTVTSICARDDMPSVKAVYGWLRTRAEFRAMYVAARAAWRLELQARADLAADQVLGPGLTPARFARIKRQVWKIESRLGRLAAKTWAVAPGRDFEPRPITVIGWPERSPTPQRGGEDGED